MWSAPGQFWLTSWNTQKSLLHQDCMAMVMVQEQNNTDHKLLVLFKKTIHTPTHMQQMHTTHIHAQWLSNGLLTQKRRWQVTAKHTCTLPMWLCMKWCDTVHGCMVYTECAETAAVSRGTSHASAVSIYHFCGYSKTRYKKLVTHVESHYSSSESARERRIALYKSDQQLYRPVESRFGLAVRR